MPNHSCLDLALQAKEIKCPECDYVMEIWAWKESLIYHCHECGATVAVGLGKPVVMIFGPTNPARINPYRCKNAIVAIDPNGRGSEIDSSDPIYAIEAVSVDLVFEKAAWHLKHQKADN